MTESVCGYPGDRDEALVTYLYDEFGDAAARAVFDAHVTTCLRCAEDLAALRGVRTHLGRWSPPEPRFSMTAPTSAGRAVGRASWWRESPAWAQVAAALLFLGVSAGIANLDVRYDANGVSIRTGWSKPAAIASAPALAAPVGTASQASFPQQASGSTDPRRTEAAPWRADLAALERQLKTEFHGLQNAAAPAGAAAHNAVDADTLRRVRALIDDSEKRQQRELALRLAEVIRDVNAKREADLLKVDRVLGTVRNDLGIQVLKNRAQMQQMDYFIRASQKQ
jgi:hypothetical protein